jgi:hypothetical protein
MEKEFVPYELALRMKALGFDEPCFGYFLSDRMFINAKITRQTGDAISSPTWQSAFRWFREKYKLNQLVTRLPKHYVGVIDSEDGIIQLFYQRHDTYEEAELACLKKLLEIVEQKEK